MIEEKKVDEEPQPTREELEDEIKHYLEEKERIKKIVGKIGGIPRTKDKVINASFLGLVMACFIIAMFVQDPKNLPLEIGLFLVSLKLIYVVTQNSRLNHSQFWMLSTLEWRLNELAKAVKKLRKSTEEKK